MGILRQKFFLYVNEKNLFMKVHKFTYKKLISRAHIKAILFKFCISFLQYSRVIYE